MAAAQEKTLVDLETKFWQSMVDQDTDAALALLTEPALMVSGHGAMKFDHAGYRKMAEQGSMVLTSFAERHERRVPERRDGRAHLPRQAVCRQARRRPDHDSGDERQLDLGPGGPAMEVRGTH
jgi:hypothetical protein